MSVAFSQGSLPEEENGLRMGLPGFRLNSAMCQGPRARYWMVSGPVFFLKEGHKVSTYCMGWFGG